MIPKEFFVTSGKAASSISALNAFDLALKKAGIAQCNIVTVSSILPAKCRMTGPKKLPSGMITYAVFAKMDGIEGDRICAGLAWAWEKNGKYGLVAEANDNVKEEALREALEWKIKEMAKIRGVEINGINYRIESLQVPRGHYGCVLSALVYLL